jgi:hypothetical protein
MERFLVRRSAHLEALQSIALTILIWGPDPTSNSAVATKRLQIQDELLAEGHNALLSEQIAPPEHHDGITLGTDELSQARAAHLIFSLIEDAPGALAETVLYGGRPEIAHKLRVMAPVRYQAGFAAHSVLMNLAKGYNAIYWYQHEDIVACNLLGQAMACAQARREMYAAFPQDLEQDLEQDRESCG